MAKEIENDQEVRTSYIKRMISDAGLTNYKELKRLAGARGEWINHKKLQSQP